ncbi:MAG: hypothetical protein KDH88_08285 [Chromatiales bacterium]|nr:hypothetical protein [Chromatiales bacterium]
MDANCDRIARVCQREPYVGNTGTVGRVRVSSTSDCLRIDLRFRDALFLFAVYLVMGPYLTYWAATNWRGMRADHPIYVQLAILLFSILGWWGLYKTVFARPRVVIDAVRRKGIAFQRGWPAKDRCFLPAVEVASVRVEPWSFTLDSGQTVPNFLLRVRNSQGTCWTLCAFTDEVQARNTCDSARRLLHVDN